MNKRKRFAVFVKKRAGSLHLPTQKGKEENEKAGAAPRGRRFKPANRTEAPKAFPLWNDTNITAQCEHAMNKRKMFSVLIKKRGRVACTYPPKGKKGKRGKKRKKAGATPRGRRFKPANRTEAPKAFPLWNDTNITA